MTISSILKTAVAVAAAGVSLCTLAAEPTFRWEPEPSDAEESRTPTDSSEDSHWATSLTVGGGNAMRVTSSGGRCYDLDSAPYANVAAKTNAFSMAVYGSAYRMSSVGRLVIVMFGDKNQADANLVFYREGANIKLGFFNNDGSLIGTEASVEMPTADEYHLYTMTADPSTGAVKIYLDDGTVSSEGSAGGEQTLSVGMQFGSIFGNINNTGFSQGKGFALLSAYGFDTALSQSDVASFASSHGVGSATAPEAISSNIDPSVGNGASLTLYDSMSAAGNQYLGVTKGTLTVAEGCTITVPHVRVENSSDSGSRTTFTVNGTVVVTSTSTDGASNTYADRNSFKGVLFGHWAGQGTYNINGSLLATNAYLGTVYTSDAQTINVNGGLLKVRGMYAYKANSTVNLSGNGVIEVSEIPSGGYKITKNFGYGTFRTIADATETRSINFNAATGTATTLDPMSYKLTLAAGTVTGSGNIRVAASESGGKVEFMSVEGYAGHITVSSGTAIYYLTDYEYAMGGDLTAFSVEVDGSLELLYGNGYPVPAERIKVTEIDGVRTYSITPNPNTWSRVESNLLSDEMNWSHGSVPADGANFCVRVDGDTEIVVDIDIDAGEMIVDGGGTATFVDDAGYCSMTVTNLIVTNASVVANGAYFQPRNVLFKEGGSLTVGDYGLLTNVVIAYSGSLPTTNEVAFTATGVGSVATDPDRWRGVVYLKSMAVTAFSSSPYGNESSVVRLTGVTGWVEAPGNYRYVNTAPLELVDSGNTLAFTVNNGNSAMSNENNNRKCSYFPAIRGSGTLACSGSATGVVLVFGDASEFTGKLALSNKMVVFGNDMPDISKHASARIYVAEGMSVKVPSSNAAWYGSGGILVDGQITLGTLDHIGGGTKITTSDTGTVVLTGYNNTSSATTNFSRISGTGTLRVVCAGWWGVSMNNFPTTMTLDNCAGNGIVMPKGSITNTIGSLKGAKYVRSDLDTGSMRDMGIVQSVDTEWSGIFPNSWLDKIDTVHIFPGTDGRSGTLTLSGTQIQTNSLHVASGAAAKLTGKWIGDVTSEGTLGGTGDIEGDVVLGDGSVLRVDDPSDLLLVDGMLTVSGNLTVRFASEADFNSANGKNVVRALDGVLMSDATFSVTVGGVELPQGRFKIEQVGDGLKLTGRSYKKQPFRVIVR